MLRAIHQRLTARGMKDELSSPRLRLGIPENRKQLEFDSIFSL